MYKIITFNAMCEIKIIPTIETNRISLSISKGIKVL